MSVDLEPTLTRVNSVLDFWFVGDSWPELFKSRWFTKNGSEEQRLLDSLVSERYTELLTGLCTRPSLFESWSSQSLDSQIAAVIILDQLSRHWFRYLESSKEVSSSSMTSDSLLLNREQCDSLALRLCERIISEHESIERLSMRIGIAQLVFVLMPLRHSKDCIKIDNLVNALNNLLSQQSDAQDSLRELMDRFRRVSLHKLSSSFSSASKSSSELSLSSSKKKKTQRDWCVVCERLPSEPASLDWCSNPPSIETINKMKKDRLLIEFVAFLKRRGFQLRRQSHLSAASAASASSSSAKSERCDQSQQKSALFVSLSGGVDSMVVLELFTQLRVCGLIDMKQTEICAIHIDYGNRQESKIEADFLKEWCELKKVKFLMRRVSEFQRGDGKLSRDDYEKQTRSIRFEMYKRALKDVLFCESDECDKSESESESDILKWTSDRGVCLGHHRGDVEENVISNCMKGASLLRLAGIADECSRIESVNVWRPLLAFNKRRIFEFAHEYGVPYFKDTTPKWSTRGRLRRELVPLLTDIYGYGTMSNLHALSQESKEWNHLIHDSLFSPMWQLCLKQPSSLACSLRIDHPKCNLANQSTLWWKITLQHICEDILGQCKVHIKAIEKNLKPALQKAVKIVSGIQDELQCDSVTKRLSESQLRTLNDLSGWMQLRREWKAYLHCGQRKSSLTVKKDAGSMDGHHNSAMVIGVWLFVFSDRMTPLSAGRKIELKPYVHSGFRLDIPIPRFTDDFTSFEIRFGPWLIKLELCKNSERSDEALLPSAHRITVNDFVEGSVYYFIPLLILNTDPPSASSSSSSSSSSYGVTLSDSSIMRSDEKTKKEDTFSSVSMSDIGYFVENTKKVLRKAVKSIRGLPVGFKEFVPFIICKRPISDSRFIICETAQIKVNICFE